MFYEALSDVEFLFLRIMPIFAMLLLLADRMVRKKKCYDSDYWMKIEWELKFGDILLF